MANEKVVGLGLCVIDHVYVVERLDFAEVRTRFTERLVLSGGMIGTAISQAAMLGCDAHVLSMLGDDEAGSLGLAIGPLRITLFALAGLMTAITVAIAGPVGFVGLIAAGVAFANPELAREALPEQVTRWLRPVASANGQEPSSAVVQTKRGTKSPMLDPS